MAPLQSTRNPPNKLITCNQRIIPRSPIKSTEIVNNLQRSILVRSRDSNPLRNSNVARHGRGIGRSPHGGEVYFCDAGGVIEVYKFDEIAVLRAVVDAGVLVLVRIILDGLGEAHGGEALREEGLVVAAAQVAVRAVYQGHLHVEVLGSAGGDFGDEAA